MDDIDALLCHKFASFLMQRAENFVILRKKPVKVVRAQQQTRLTH